MFDFIYGIPLLITGIALVVIFGSLAAAGLFFVRRRILPRIRFNEEDAVFSSTILLSIMVIYGLMMALVAISVWERYSDTERVVSQEATELAVLYRDVTRYPLPARTQLQEALKKYVEYVIHESWPEQRKGIVPRGGIERIDLFERTLATFEPATEGQKTLHAETLRTYDEMIEARRLRMDAGEAALPGIMWVMMFIGAAMGLTGSFFFRVSDPRLQLIHVVLFAAFIAMVIFMVLAFDRPFQGGVRIGSESFELIYNQLMKR